MIKMDEVFEKFLEDQKMKIAEEKACLEQDPPYMEIRRRKDDGLQKEINRPITSQQDGVSLPLGEEYERKKHRLQEELRKDYRKYMVERDHWGAGEVHMVPERRRLSKTVLQTVRMRDVATLTEVCGLGWGVCSSEEDCSDEELILLQGRRLQRERDTRTVNRKRGEFYTENNHTSKLQYKNRMSASIAAQANERSDSMASQDTVCTTGLLIGAADQEISQERRKEHYRRELQEQIMEKQKHKRREKELDLKISFTGVMDSEKHIFGSETPGYRRVGETDRRHPRDEIIRLETTVPPEGLLKYRTDLLSPCRATFVPSHLPALAEAYRSPNNDAESPSTAYGPIAGVSFPTSSRETHLLSPHNEPRRSAYRTRFLGENEGVASGLPVFSMHQPKTDRHSYKVELQKQIEERAAQKKAEKEERWRLEAEMEADMRAYEPWGRGGGGAPLRDSTGNLITDLKRMHLLNATGAVQRQERPGFAQPHSPEFTRRSVSTNQLPSPQQLEQDQYKAYLRHQMEEKRRKQTEEREQQRAEEEKEDRRLAEQREKIRREYEEEQEGRRRREMEQKLKNEELTRLAEERRTEAEKKKKEEEEKERAALKKQEEQERRIKRQQAERQSSPPIPTLQNKHSNAPQATAPLTSDNRNHLKAERDRIEVVKELCVLSRRLRSEQQRLEEQLLQSDWDNLPSAFTDRCRADVFDMARLRMPVRGPSSRGIEPVSFKENDDIMYRDVLRPLSRTQQYRYRDVEGGRGSVLLSESEFIDHNGAAFPVPPDVERKSTRLSARERRRLANLQSATENQKQSLNMRKLGDTNTHKMKPLQYLRHHDITAGCCSDEEKDEAGNVINVLTYSVLEDPAL